MKCSELQHRLQYPSVVIETQPPTPPSLLPALKESILKGDLFEFPSVIVDYSLELHIKSIVLNDSSLMLICVPSEGSTGINVILSPQTLFEIRNKDREYVLMTDKCFDDTYSTHLYKDTIIHLYLKGLYK